MKTVVIKRELRFKGHEKCLQNNKAIFKTQHRFASKEHNVFTEKAYKIAKSFNDDKRVQAPDGVKTYSYIYGC